MRTQTEKVAHLRLALETLFRLCGTKDTYADDHTSREYAAELRRCIEAGHITPMLVHGVLLFTSGGDPHKMPRIDNFLRLFLLECWHERT